MTPRRIMHIIGSVELTTLVLMLLNLFTVHRPAFTQVLGPAHGLAYTATVIAAVLLMNGRHRVWLRALVPGIGGLLAARAILSAHGFRREGMSGEVG
ncbi:hypothetical protein [Saccharopolyspora sp. NPDC002376]